MEESESSSSASTSPNKRPADPDVQEAAPRKKANSTSIHQEFARFKFTKGGEERTGRERQNTGRFFIKSKDLKLNELLCSGCVDSRATEAW